MSYSIADIPSKTLERIRSGCVIPATPLALTRERTLDERRQRALIRYYRDAGAGGVAVAVHTTQFEIREPEFDLLEPVLRVCAHELKEADRGAGESAPIARIAGIVGRTDQAVGEAELARSYDYHAGLLSLSAFAGATLTEMIAHAKAVAEVIPLVGFYLQPAVGGRVLPAEFWREFAKIGNVLAIKIAPFNRYRTIDVVRGVCEAGREGDIALYTGNDDNIVVDLLSEYRVHTESGPRTARIVGGLLGHWSVWTKKAVEYFERIQAVRESGDPIPRELLTLNLEVTDANAAFFDVANEYRGVIAGVHEVLRRQGLFAGRWCLADDGELSPGQSNEIDRVYDSYPHLSDDQFVAANRERWLTS